MSAPASLTAAPHPVANQTVLSRTGRRLLLAMIAAGLAVRIVVAFKTYGVVYDMDSFVAVRAALADHPLHIYSVVNGHPYLRWPYPPAFLPWIALSGSLSHATGLAFPGWVRLPEIFADGAIAWLVQHYLGRRGLGERARLAAAGLVALGPAFGVISGYHGQIDSIAILPAVVALVLWERSPPGVRRALIAGILIGVGTGIKTVPALMLFALLPSTRSWRERLVLYAAPAIVVLAMLAPFLVADGHATIHSLRAHRGLPGFGGISLLVQPDLAKLWLLNQNLPLSSLSRTLFNDQTTIVAVLLAPFAVLLLVRRTPPALAATVLWLAFYVLGIAFGLEYLPWGLPFALMAGYIWQVAAIQAVLLVPTILLYWHGILAAPQDVYVPLMIATWAVMLVVLARMALRMLPRRRAAAA